MTNTFTVEVISHDNFNGDPWCAIGSQFLVEDYKGLNGNYYRVILGSTKSSLIPKLDTIVIGQEGYPTVPDITKLRDLQQNVWILVHSENFVYAFESLFIKRTSDGTHIAFAHSKPNGDSILLTPEDEIHYIADSIQLFDINLAMDDFNDYTIYALVDLFLTPYSVKGGSELIYNLLFKTDMVKQQPDIPYDTIKDMAVVYTSTFDTPPLIRTEGVTIEKVKEAVLV